MLSAQKLHRGKRLDAKFDFHLSLAEDGRFLAVVTKAFKDELVEC